MSERLFLKARWSNLLMLNYEVDPVILQPHIPPGTILDTWQGKTLVTMVGFLFKETRMLGVRWPFHINFEEVNLRFYVRYFDGKIWKRGAVFVSEIVPKYAIAIIANTLYNEHYRAMRMRHQVIIADACHTRFIYEWKFNNRWNQLAGTVNNNLKPILAGSPEEFIFEHYWGYNKLSESKTIEYQVEHMAWQTGEVTGYLFDADISKLYGKEFEPWLSRPPISVFFADGSDVVVRVGTKFNSPYTTSVRSNN